MSDSYTNYIEETRKRDERIATSMDSGRPVGSLANEHNVSRQRIYQIYEKVRGRSFRPKIDIEEAAMDYAIKRVIKEGNIARVAREENVPQWRLDAEAQRTGAIRKYKENVLRKARQLVANGASLSDAAIRVGKSEAWLRKYGVGDGTG